MSSKVLHSVNSFCEEVSTGNLASTSTPIGKNLTSLQTSPDFDQENCSPITRSAKRSKINSENVAKSRLLNHMIPKSKNDTNGINADVMNKRKDPSTKNDMVSKKIKKMEMLKKKNSSIFEEEIDKLVEKSSSHSTPVTRNMFKQMFVDRAAAATAKRSLVSNGNKSMPNKNLQSKHEKTSAKSNIFKPSSNENAVHKKIDNVNYVQSRETNLENSHKSTDIMSRPSIKSSIKKKLYSNASDFTDNDNNNIGETSFSEGKKVVNIYECSKKLDPKCDSQTVASLCDKNKNSAKFKSSHAETYSLRAAKISKKYIGNKASDNSVVYKTTSKNETNKHIIDLIKGCLNPNSKTDISQPSLDNKTALDESESENMFSLQEDSQHSKDEKPTKTQKSAPKRKYIKKDNKIPKRNENVNKPNKKSSKISQTKAVKSISSKTVNAKKSNIRNVTVKRNTPKQKKVDSLKKNGSKIMTAKTNNTSMNKKSKNKRSISQISDNLSDHGIKRSKIPKKQSKNNAKSRITCRKRRGSINSDEFLNKCSMKYNTKNINTVFQPDNMHYFNENNFDSDLYRSHKTKPHFYRDIPSLYDGMHPYNYNNYNNENRMCTYNSENLPKFLTHDPHHRFYTADDFEQFYNRHYPESSHSPNKNLGYIMIPIGSSALQSNARQNHSSFSISLDQNYKNATEALTKELCEQKYQVARERNYIEYDRGFVRDRKISTLSRNNHLEQVRRHEYSQNMLVNDNYMRRRLHAERERKYLEYERGHRDVPRERMIPNVSKSNYLERVRRHEFSQNMLLNDNRTTQRLQAKRERKYVEYDRGLRDISIDREFSSISQSNYLEQARRHEFSQNVFPNNNISSQKSQATRERKYIEYDHGHRDMLMNREFPSISQNNYATKTRRHEFSQNIISNDNKSRRGLIPTNDRNYIEYDQDISIDSEFPSVSHIRQLDKITEPEFSQNMLLNDNELKQRPQATWERKHIEYEQDESTDSEFPSVIHNYAVKEKGPEISQNRLSNNKAICMFMKKSTMVKSNNTVSCIENCTNISNHPTTKKQQPNSRETIVSQLNNKYKSHVLSNKNVNYNEQNHNTEKYQEPTNNINSLAIEKVETNKKSDNFKATSMINKIQSKNIQLDSPILRKFNKFNERLNNVTDIDSWHNNFSVIPEPNASSICSDNLKVALYDRYKKKPKSLFTDNDKPTSTVQSADQKSDDSWITIERPTLPQSPWRRSETLE